MDYRREDTARQQVMTLCADEFIQLFQLHILPHGFHRIRHYGLLASATRKANLARDRERLEARAPEPPIETGTADAITSDQRRFCPCCGGRMSLCETFARWRQPRGLPSPPAAARECSP